jgi:hypothetical protein
MAAGAPHIGHRYGGFLPSWMYPHTLHLQRFCMPNLVSNKPKME